MNNSRLAHKNEAQNENLVHSWFNRNALHVDISWVTWVSKWKVDKILDSFMWVRDESQAWKEAREEWIKVFNPLSDIYWEEITNPEFVFINDREEYLEQQVKLLKIKIFSHVSEHWNIDTSFELSDFERYLLDYIDLLEEDLSPYIETYLKNKSMDLLQMLTKSTFEFKDMSDTNKEILWYWFLKWFISLEEISTIPNIRQEEIEEIKQLSKELDHLWLQYFANIIIKLNTL